MTTTAAAMVVTRGTSWDRCHIRPLQRNRFNLRLVQRLASVEVLGYPALGLYCRHTFALVTPCRWLVFLSPVRPVATRPPPVLTFLITYSATGPAKSVFFSPCSVRYLLSFPASWGVLGAGSPRPTLPCGKAYKSASVRAFFVSGAYASFLAVISNAYRRLPRI